MCLLRSISQTVPQMACAVAWNARGLMVAAVMVLIVAGAVGVVRAQTCETDALANLWFACELYVSTPSMVTPDKNCCYNLQLLQTRYGLDCYCQVLLENSGSATYGTNLVKVYDLPQDCNVAANMTQCPSPGPASSSSGGSSTPTAVAPTNPVSSLLPPSSSKSSGGSSSSLGVPIGASVGGGSVFILIIYLILRYACKMHLKWDLNQPCACCGPRQPQKEPDDKPNGVGVPPVTTMNSAALNAPYQVGLPPVMRMNSAALNAPYQAGVPPLMRMNGAALNAPYRV